MIGKNKETNEKQKNEVMRRRKKKKKKIKENLYFIHTFLMIFGSLKQAD